MIVQDQEDGVHEVRRKQKGTLSAWLKDHSHRLYPSRKEKEELARMADMSYIQVSRWFANKRRKVKSISALSTDQEPDMSADLEKPVVEEMNTFQSLEPESKLSQAPDGFGFDLGTGFGNMLPTRDDLLTYMLLNQAALMNPQLLPPQFPLIPLFDPTSLQHANTTTPPLMPSPNDVMGKSMTSFKEYDVMGMLPHSDMIKPRGVQPMAEKAGNEANRLLMTPGGVTKAQANDLMRLPVNGLHPFAPNEVFPRSANGVTRSDDAMGRPTNGVMRSDDVMSRPTNGVMRSDDVMSRPANGMVRRDDVNTWHLNDKEQIAVSVLANLARQKNVNIANTSIAQSNSLL